MNKDWADKNKRMQSLTGKIQEVLGEDLEQGLAILEQNRN